MFTIWCKQQYHGENNWSEKICKPITGWQWDWENYSKKTQIQSAEVRGQSSISTNWSVAISEKIKGWVGIDADKGFKNIEDIRYRPVGN